jgi:hypothetical protein
LHPPHRENRAQHTLLSRAGEKRVELSISPLENAEYRATRDICWEKPGAHAEKRGLMRLSPLENAEYTVKHGVYWEIHGSLG